MKQIIISTLLLFLPTKAFSDTATYYHQYFEGKKMSNGKIYRGERRTAAHMYLRMGTLVKVTNKQTNKYTYVTITDRGSFSHRNIDLSMRAFKDLAPLSKGRISVTIEIVKINPYIRKTKNNSKYFTNRTE